MTNGDKIRAMSDEELATYLSDMRIDNGELVNYCKDKEVCCDELDKGNCIPDEWCKQCILDWVKEVDNHE